MKKLYKNIIAVGALLSGLVLYHLKKDVIIQWQSEKLKATSADKQVRGQFDNQKIYFLSI